MTRKFLAGGFAMLLFAVILFSCSKNIDYKIISEQKQLNIGNGHDTLELHFLGTACFWVSYKGNAFLTDPFISNPSFWKTMYGNIRPDAAIINDFITKSQLEQIDLVTVGHAHYDHLLDLPYMQQFILSDAKIIGSPTAHHIIASTTRQEKIMANDFCATATKPGQWIYSHENKMRVMPVVSDHPPHFMGITMFNGCYSEDLSEIPERIYQWKMGEPFAYLIDFLEADGSVSYRIWVQTSGSEYPLRFIPESLLTEKSVDAAMFSIATRSKYELYPDRIISLLKPKVVFMAHWENFLRNKYKSLKTVQKGDPEKLYYHLKEKFAGQSEIILPKPGGTFKLY